MKRFLLLIAFCPLVAIGQTNKIGNAYIGAIIHDFNKPGASFVASLGVNKYLGAGAGVDITSYNKSIFAPAYLDIRPKYPIKAFTPYAVGQFGIPVYNRNEGTGIFYTDTTGGGRKEIHLKTSGKLLFGGGVGVSYKVNKVGLYTTIILRSYHFNNETTSINGNEVKFDTDETMGVVNLGVIF